MDVQLEMQGVQCRLLGVSLIYSRATYRWKLFNNPPSGRYLKTNVASLLTLLLVLKYVGGISSRSPNLEESTVCCP